MFEITWNKGFHMTFANGWTASVQFGSGNYCSNRNDEFGMPSKPCADAEIAAWNGDVWFKFGDGGDVKGYVTPDEVLKFFNEVAAK